MNKINLLNIIITLSFFCFSSTSLADNTNTKSPQLTEIACRYEMHITPIAKSGASTKKSWFFWRKAAMVQTLNTDGQYGEIWEQTPTGTIYYRKLYHSDKTAVEYMPADNPSNTINFDWIKLSNILSQQELEALSTVKKLKVLGRNAELRKGKIDGQSLEVKWLIQENLPASIIKRTKNSRMELRLLEIERLSTAHRQPVSSEKIAQYRHIDAVDFGDMENDPFIKKILAAEGHHH